MADLQLTQTWTTGNKLFRIMKNPDGSIVVDVLPGFDVPANVPVESIEQVYLQLVELGALPSA